MVRVDRVGARSLGIVRLAFQQLRQRWLESLFIVLGIAMGVGVFTGMETYIRYAQSVTRDITRANPHLTAVRVQTQSFAVTAFSEAETPLIRLEPTLRAPVQLELDHLLTFRNELSVVGALLSGGSTRITTLLAVDGESVASASNSRISIRFMSPDELLYRTFLAGIPFTWESVTNREPQLVLDDRTAKTLFPDLAFDEIVGRTLTAGATVWTIAGIVKGDEEDRFFLSDDELMVYGPIQDNTVYREFTILPAEGVDTEEMIREVQAYVDQVYGPGQISVRQPALTVGSEVGYIVSLLALAGLALLIAAVNILNLFTARVLRRQRYSGMSVALGATRSMLFWQTAGEALLLGLVGSILGLLIVHGLVHLLVAFLASGLDGYTVRNPYEGMALTSIDAAVGVGIGTGMSLLFGLYPGWLASQQQPAEALRTE